MKPRISLLLVLTLSMGAIAIALHAASDQSANYTTRTLALPDHGQGNITMDYIAYDPKTGYVWVPAINVGSVYVVDTGDGSVLEIPGFATNEVDWAAENAVRGPAAYRWATEWFTSATVPIPAYAPLMNSRLHAKPVATSIPLPTV